MLAIVSACDPGSEVAADEPAAAGGKADEFGAGELCDEELAPCPSGLVCELDADLGLIPVCKVPDGAVCSYGDPCLRGSACAWDAELDPDGLDGRCEPAEPCEVTCVLGFRCDLLATSHPALQNDAICVQVPDADQGGACGGFTGARCVDGAICVPDGNPPPGWPGVCRPGPSDCVQTGCAVGHECAPCTREVAIPLADLDWSDLRSGLGGLHETLEYDGCVDLSVGYDGSFCSPPGA